MKGVFLVLTAFSFAGISSGYYVCQNGETDVAKARRMGLHCIFFNPENIKTQNFTSTNGEEVKWEFEQVVDTKVELRNDIEDTNEPMLQNKIDSNTESKNEEASNGRSLQGNFESKGETILTNNNQDFSWRYALKARKLADDAIFKAEEAKNMAKDFQSQNENSLKPKSAKSSQAVQTKTTNKSKVPNKKT